MTKKSIVSVAEVDLLAATDSGALMKTDEEAGYQFLGNGNIWDATKTGVVGIFGESHHERYFYRVRQDRLSAFYGMLFQHLPKKVFVYASTLRGECLDLKDKGLMIAVIREMARQNESDAGEMQYIH